jgi:hypothetical protein
MLTRALVCSLCGVQVRPCVAKLIAECSLSTRAGDAMMRVSAVLCVRMCARSIVLSVPSHAQQGVVTQFCQVAVASGVPGTCLSTKHTRVLVAEKNTRTPTHLTDVKVAAALVVGNCARSQESAMTLLDADCVDL